MVLNHPKKRIGPVKRRNRQAGINGRPDGEKTTLRDLAPRFPVDARATAALDYSEL